MMTWTKSSNRHRVGSTRTTFETKVCSDMVLL